MKQVPTLAQEWSAIFPEGLLLKALALKYLTGTLVENNSSPLKLNPFFNLKGTDVTNEQ